MTVYDPNLSAVVSEYRELNSDSNYGRIEAILKENQMRFLVKVKPDLERTNKSIVEGRFDETMQQVLSHLKPEAAYFFEEDGYRTAIFVVDIQKAAEIPNIGEPFFHRMGAEVHFHPVMSAQDLRESNLHQTATQWSRA